MGPLSLKIVERHGGRMSEEKNVKLESFVAVKSGMTRIFDEKDGHIPVTVLKIVPNYISQVKKQDREGYQAYQVSCLQKRSTLISKPKSGHLKKAGLENLSFAFEVKVDLVDESVLGAIVNLENFPVGAIVDVEGTSKGKGFQGVMKRHNFSGGPAAHGSHFHRRTGSVGNRATPARVFPRKKMPGQLGVDKVKVQNLKVVGLNIENGYILIKGAVPGAKGGIVRVSRAVKGN